MDLITETYLGWDPLTHLAHCPAPAWDTVEVRRTDGIRAQSMGAYHHNCEHPNCEHADAFQRVQLRLACRDCGTVHVISGEGLTEAHTDTSLTGWGQAPARYGDVWLWPGRPAVPGGSPHEYLVTRQETAVTRATLYGIVIAYRDSNGARCWLAAAEPADDGAHQVSTLRWRHASTSLASIEEAAEWLGVTAGFQQRPLVVAF
ncbi:hypothetical protein ABZZ79_03445 [Streptomyces sp. NPDC006458]|uniref:hypothetical protein n=1 Tax=Streptomyces sp. NPDC006458 TaxID=3154302 RepID=UPI0033AF784C